MTGNGAEATAPEPVLPAGGAAGQSPQGTGPAPPETLVVGPPSERPRTMVAPPPTVGERPRGPGVGRRLNAHGVTWRRALIVCAVVVVAVAAGVLEGHLRTRVAYRVSAAGAQLGGLTPADAEEKIAGVIDDRSLDTVTLQTPQGPLALPLASLGLSLDVEATAARAARRGRLDVVPGLDLWYGGGGGVEPVVRFDAATFQQGLQQIREAVETESRDARLVLRGETIGVKPSADGVAIDEVALQRGVLAALTEWRRFDGAVPTSPAQPSVSTAAARQAAAEAAVYLSGPLKLRYRSRVVELSPQQIAAMLTVNEGGDAGEYPLTFDNPGARRLLHQLFAFVETRAVNASVVLQGKKVVIKPSREGFGLDIPRLLSDMDDAASRQGLREVAVPLTVLRPTRTTEQLQEMGLAGYGSEFSTYYDPENKARANNIVQAAKLVDGTIVRPGQVFSLNATTGPRTTDRGFDYAPVIVDGVLRQGVGGGVCQFATTLFNAAFFAGLPIVERHPHDFFIDHYPIGRDAAVSWGSKDLKFRNDSDRTLMIRCWARGGQLTIVLVGDTGRTVDYTTTRFYNVRPPAYSKSRPRVIYDADISSGVVSWEKGYDGGSVRVVRTVTQGGRVLLRDTFVSTYAPKDWIKRIGTR